METFALIFVSVISIAANHIIGDELTETPKQESS